jgi:hypothetical protein
VDSGNDGRSTEDREHVEWLERVSAAAARAAADLRRQDGFYHQRLISDLEELGQRLKSELARLRRD